MRAATNCSGLGITALAPTTGVKTGKTQNQQMFSGLPPKTDLPPDLRTTPAASFSRTPPSRPRASARSRASECPLCGGRRRWRLRRPRGRRLRWPRRQDGDAEGEVRSRRGHLRPLLPQSSSACASARACLGSCNHRSRGKGCGKQFVIMDPR
jgi:hypothetical protein